MLVQTLPLVSNISLDYELPPELISYREDENNSKEESGEHYFGAQSSDSKEESYLEIVTEESYEEKIF